MKQETVYLVVYNDEHGEDSMYFSTSQGTVSQAQESWIRCYPFYDFVAIQVA